MIYDCFMFFNELDLLEMRMEILDEYVDKFVIVESTYTHSLKPKKLYFNENEERFSKFKNKIIHVVKNSYNMNETKKHLEERGVTHFESMTSPFWLTETENRNAIMDGLKNCNDEDIIIISDVDEIPDFSIINDFLNSLDNINYNTIYDCSGLMFYYYLNVIMNNQWVNSKIMRYKTLTDNNLLPTDTVRYSDSFNRIKISNCGWHFSYLGDENQIRDKLTSFMHQEMLNGDIVDVNKIKERKNNLKDPLNRGYYNYSKVSLTLLPKYIQNNKEKYKKYILD